MDFRIIFWIDLIYDDTKTGFVIPILVTHQNRDPVEPLSCMRQSFRFGKKIGYGL